MRFMNSQPASASARQIVWPTVVTVLSAAILIGAEVFGAAFAGGWALAILFGLEDTGAHILQAVLFAAGVFVMAAFIRAAQRVEPFTRRA
jgi:nitric oxide reductase large subunit